MISPVLSTYSGVAKSTFSQKEEPLGIVLELTPLLMKNSLMLCFTKDNIWKFSLNSDFANSKYCFLLAIIALTCSSLAGSFIKLRSWSLVYSETCIKIDFREYKVSFAKSRLSDVSEQIYPKRPQYVRNAWTGAWISVSMFTHRSFRSYRSCMMSVYKLLTRGVLTNECGVGGVSFNIFTKW